MTFPVIRQVRASVVRGGRADYHGQQGAHWIDDHIATPMSRYPEYRQSRRSFGINVLGTLAGQRPVEAARPARLRCRVESQHCPPSSLQPLTEAPPMKLLRYGPAGQEKPGLLDARGQLRSLAGHVADIGPAQLAPASLNALGAIAPDTLPLVSGNPRLGVPFAGTRKFIAIGLNYADHAAESNLPIPTEPVIFTKAVSCLQGPNDPVMLPQDSKKTDWEVELGVVIGTTARYVEQGEALDYVAGYAVVNDVSEREYQMDRGGTWDKGKGCDTFGPVGPWLVTRDEVGDVQKLDMWLDVNGQRMQAGNTRTMIFGVARLVSYTSRFLTLEPGDIITTGTPPGVGMGKKPNPVYLKAGDAIRLSIEKLGEQSQQVIAWRRPG
jgi:2,4-didehydro-3-deoxy-L-rhamnonate hydrolase